MPMHIAYDHHSVYIYTYIRIINCGVHVIFSHVGAPVWGDPGNLWKQYVVHVKLPSVARQI